MSKRAEERALKREILDAKAKDTKSRMTYFNPI